MDLDGARFVSNVPGANAAEALEGGRWCLCAGGRAGLVETRRLATPAANQANPGKQASGLRREKGAVVGLQLESVRLTGGANTFPPQLGPGIAMSLAAD